MSKERWIPEGEGWTEENVSRLLDIWQGHLDLERDIEARRLARVDDPDPPPTEAQLMARRAECDRALAQLTDARVRAKKVGLDESEE